MYFLRKIRGNRSRILITIFLLAVIVTLPAIMTTTNTTINLAQGQQTDQMNSTVADSESANLQNMTEKIVHVGDIDIAYKMLGKGEPIILFNGASENMDAWDPSFISDLSSNHTVIVFDQRGIGNTTVGSKPYTIEQLANDTAGLLDALKIPKADVMGYSLGSYLAQQLTMMYPDKVNSLVLVASSCGGMDHTPKPPEFMKFISEVVNKSLNNIPLTTEEIKSIVSSTLGSGWIKLHPESLDIPANITSLEQLRPGLPPEIVNNQNNVGKHWEATNSPGACNELAKLAKPTLVITGTDDDKYQPYVNSLKIVEKIPGAWLVQIKDAGHAIMGQYPAEIGKILQTFLSTTNTTTTTTAQPE